jgi:hypothetical protein
MIDDGCKKEQIRIRLSAGSLVSDAVEAMKAVESLFSSMFTRISNFTNFASEKISKE